ncbi:MAG TPA: transglutaminase family protein [Burkholderiaceae bacterium]
MSKSKLQTVATLGICLLALALPCLAISKERFASSELRAQFALPESRVDLAQAKLTIDQIIDPSINREATLHEVDALIKSVRERIRPAASKRDQMDVLLETLYKPGPWNGNRPFSYDLSDPMGRNAHNKLLSTYLASRKGNCVSMPILLAIMAQRLGLTATLATAPEHLFVQFVNDQSMWMNVEATAGGYKQVSSYVRETGISETALKNEIYLRPLSPREALGAMSASLMEHYAAQRDGEALLVIANMALTANPKDTVAMVHKANANYLLLEARFTKKYLRAADIPKDQREDFKALGRENLAWFAKAEQLGWSQPSEEKDDDYLKSVEQEKSKRSQGQAAKSNP